MKNKFLLFLSVVFLGIGQIWGQTYELVTSNAQLEEGAEYIILGQRSNNTILVMTTTQNNNNRGGVVIPGTTLPTTLEAEANYAVFKLGLSDGHWTFYDAENEGFLYAASSSSNHLRTRANDSDGNSRWEINIENDNIASVVAQGTNSRKVMQLNNANNQDLFACYGSASQAPVYLYKKGVASTDPILNASETEITGLGYMEGNTPASQSFSLNGLNLDPANGNITVTAPANFQVSTDDISFSNSLNISYSGGTLASTDVYVRLNESLAINTYTGNITISGGGASDAIVSVEGIVTAFSEECGEEDFSLSSLTASYNSGSFTGNNDVVWSYVNARNEGDYPINGNGILFQGNTSANVSATVSNGVGTLTFQARKAFTGGNNNRQLQVYINNNLVFTTPTFGTASTDTTIHTFTVENINVTGDVAIRIQNATGNQVTIDNITWTCYSGTQPTTPTLTTSVSELTDFVYGLGSGPSVSQSFALSGINLDGSEDITILAGGGFEISLNDVDYFEEETLSAYDGTATNIYVRLKSGLPVDTYSGIILIGGYGTDAEVTVSGNVFAPTLTTSTSNLTGFTYNHGAGPSSSQTFTLSGSYLDGAGNVDILPGDNWEISTDLTNWYGYDDNGIALNNYNGINTAIHVRLIAGLSVDTYNNPSNDIIIIDGYSNDLEITLSGEVLQPNIQLNNSEFSQFTYAEGQGPSTHQTFSVSGTNLASDISINVHNESWEISTNQNFTTPLSSLTLTRNASNAVSNTNIHIRLKAGLAQGDYDNIAGLQVTSTNALTQTADLDGLVTAAVPYINVRSTTNPFPTISGDGTNTPIAPQNTLFAQQTIGDSQTKSYNIENLGGLPLVINSIDIEGANPGDFTVLTPIPTTIPANNNAEFSITFSPLNIGERNAIVKISNNSSNINNYLFNVRGTGNNAEINVSGNGINIPSGNTTISEEDNTFIGTVNLSSTTSTLISKEFIVHNTGNITLNISGISITGTHASEFSVSPSTMNISAGNTGSFVITFTPTTPGIKNATLNITNNDVTDGENPYIFAIQGKTVEFIECESGELGELEIIAIQDFEITPATPTLQYTWSNIGEGPGTSTGIVSGNSPPDDASPSNSPYYTSNSRGYRIQGKDGNNYGGRRFEFASINTLTYNEISLSVRIAAMSIGSNYNGMDNTSDERVLIEVSPDNGITWYSQAILRSSIPNGRWAFNSATGIGSRNYQEHNTFTSFLNNERAISGINPNVISTLEITNLPSVENLKVRISANSNADNEYWIIDDIIITGKKLTGISEKIWYDGSWSGDGLPPTSSQKAIFEGNYFSSDDTSIAGELNACACEVRNGANVTIATDDSFIIQSDLIITDGTFTLENDANLVQVNEDALNTGTIIVHRESKPMVRQDATGWSSPVSGQNVRNFSPGTLINRFYIYNGYNVGENGSHFKGIFEDTDNYPMPLTIPAEWPHDGIINVNQFNPDTYTFKPGWGYSIRVKNNHTSTEPRESVNGIFTGTPHNGNYNVPAYGKYTMVGNPYPSAIEIDEFFTENTDVDAIHVWTHVYPTSDSENYNSNYSTITRFGEGGNTVPGSSPMNGNIAIGQGFVVEDSSRPETTDTRWTINFNNGMRVADRGIFQRNIETTEKHRFWLNVYDITTDLSIAQVLLGYMTGATNDYDHQLDGRRMGSAPLYSLIDEEKYTVQARALPFSEEDIIPLGISPIVFGKYKIEIDRVDGLFDEGQEIYLKDNYLQTLHNLSLDGGYEFEAEVGEFHDRFEIVFKPEEVMETIESELNNLLVYHSGENLVIESKNERILSVELYDLNGKSVHRNEKVNAHIYQIHRMSLATQVLIVKVLTENGEIRSKKIINH